MWCVETRTRTKKKKATFYLQNRWNEWKRSVEGEKLHTRSDSFLSNFYRARDVRSQREGYVTHRTIRTFSSSPPPPYRETSIRCKHTNCRFTILHCILFFLHHHLRHFYTAIEYSPFDPLVVALFLLVLYTSFLLSFLSSFVAVVY